MKKRAACFAMACLLITGAEFIYPTAYAIVSAQEDWKTEFDTICAKTNDPLTLSKAEVKDLIERCNKLQLRIEKLDESTAKVYMKRLRMCRDLFVFVLESEAK
jgi:hypothetical protein